MTPNGAFALVTTNLGYQNGVPFSAARVLDTATNTVAVGGALLENSPVGIALAPSGDSAYVTNYGSNNVSVLDTRALPSVTVTDVIGVGTHPDGVAVAVVHQTSTTTNLTTSANPAAVGDEVTFTATISPVPDGGTVTFADDATGMGCDAVAVSTADGTATCTKTYDAVGDHQVTADYTGTSTYLPSTSTAMTQAIDPAPTMTRLTSSANPARPNDPVTYTATVTPTPDGGSVSFTDNGTPVAACESVTVSGGNAWCTTTYSLPGSHEIFAAYAGTANYVASTSAALAVTVSDTTAPTIDLPDDLAVTATSSSGAAVTYSATARDEVDGDLAVACTPPSGADFPLGVTAVTCTATDLAGNTGAATFHVSVTYAWSGVRQPVNADGTSVFKLGSTIPVKFSLAGASAGISDVVATLSYAKITDDIEGTYAEASTNVAATIGNTFRYDAAEDLYIYNWTTKSLTPGTYAIRLTLHDGRERTIRLSLR
jgi:YVTN family beta-propeller protein